jgi:hypothetical protein
MPVIGFISADGTSDQPEGQGHCSFEFALQLAKDRHEAFPYPYPLLKGIVDAVQNRGDYISATSVLHCLRADYLKRKENYYSTVESMYPSFRGTLFHGLLEKNAPDNARIEEKVKRTYKGIEIGGTFDSLLCFPDADEKKYIIQDWKTTENLPKYDSPYSSHLVQVNLYRWLLGFKPEDVVMEVHYFSMKGHKVCRLKDGTGISRGGRAPVNQHWSDAQVESYLDDRLIKLKASMVTNVPMPYAMVGEDEKWECEYCPVRQKCATLARAEEEAAWRKRAGLEPTGAVGEDSVAWVELIKGVEARLEKAGAK